MQFFPVEVLEVPDFLDVFLVKVLEVLKILARFVEVVGMHFGILRCHGGLSNIEVLVNPFLFIILCVFLPLSSVAKLL